MVYDVSPAPEGSEKKRIGEFASLSNAPKNDRSSIRNLNYLKNNW
jgi:hypothetical protein